MKSHHSMPEELLRKAWSDQRFARGALMTADGRPMVVIDPGQQNEDSGPDFKRARIRIGDIQYSGDVEIHRNAREWTLHAHDRDARYNRVILHAVLHGSDETSYTESGRGVPEFVMAEHLDNSHYRTQIPFPLDGLPGVRRIRCSGLNDGVDPEVIERWVLRLAQQRLEFKVRKFDERLKQLIDESRSFVREPSAPYVGDPSEIPQPEHEYTRQDYARLHLWDQLIYEGVMEGLGYSKNRLPMLILARNAPLQFLKRLAENTREEDRLRLVQAALFGAGGLLPSIRTAKDKGTHSSLRDLKRQWKEIRPRYKGQILHPAEWHFFRLRPQNFPTLRLAAASVLALQFSSGGVLRQVIHIVKDASTDSETTFKHLRELLIAKPDEYWSSHYTFERATQQKVQTLIGVDRMNDIIINTFVPVSLLYARVFRDLSLREQTMDLLGRFPALSDNILTRTMDRELLKGRFKVDSAMAQQGVIQLFKHYCKEERCLECDVGKKVFLHP